MKIKILTALFFTAGFLPLMAQNSKKVTCGITAGISNSSVKITGMDNHVMRAIQGDNIFGIEGGFFTKIKMNPLYVKPSMMIHYKNGTVDVYNVEGFAYAKSDFKMTKLETPLLFGINIIGPVNVEAGPVYNHVLSVTQQYNGHSTTVPRNGLGYRAGVNAELGQLALGVSYQAITNMSTTRGTFESPKELILSAAFTFCSKPGSAPYGR